MERAKRRNEEAPAAFEDLLLCAQSVAGTPTAATAKSSTHHSALHTWPQMSLTLGAWAVTRRVLQRERMLGSSGARRRR